MSFNLQPGTGLGFSGSKQIALGLGTPYTVVVIVVPPVEEEEVSRQGSPGGGGRYAGVVDYGYGEAAQKTEITRRIIQDDNEVFEIIIIALESDIL